MKRNPQYCRVGDTEEMIRCQPGSEADKKFQLDELRRKYDKVTPLIPFIGIKNLILNFDFNFGLAVTNGWVNLKEMREGQLAWLKWKMSSESETITV